MRRLIYKTGEKIGSCEYISESEKKGKLRAATFKCECGNLFVTTIDKVKVGHTTSCGCAHKAMLLKRNQSGFNKGVFKGRIIINGESVSLSSLPEYKNWKHMINRCFNPAVKNYAIYGGRGITVCERWKDFFNFFSDMGKRPSKIHSVDRFPNKDGNYEPSNCRWATPKEQGNNTNHNFFIEYNGETKTLMEWSDKLKFNYHTVKVRLRKLKWSVEKAFETPIKTYQCQ